MEIIKRYAALDSAALKALAKLRSVGVDGDGAAATERLVAQDEEMGVEDGPTLNDASAASTEPDLSPEGGGRETSKKKRRRGKKGGVKSKEKGMSMISSEKDDAEAGRHMKSARAPVVTEEIQTCTLVTLPNKEVEAADSKLLEVVLTSMDPLWGIVKGYRSAVAALLLVGFPGIIMVALVRILL